MYLTGKAAAGSFVVPLCEDCGLQCVSCVGTCQGNCDGACLGTCGGGCYGTCVLQAKLS